MTLKAVSFAAKSGTGKTTLLEKIVSLPALDLNDAVTVAGFIQRSCLK